MNAPRTHEPSSLRASAANLSPLEKDALREVKRLNDWELVAFRDRMARERLENATYEITEWMQWIGEWTVARLEAAEKELQRRRDLAERGGPRVNGRRMDVDGVKAAHPLRAFFERELGPPVREHALRAWWCCPLHGEDTPSLEVDVMLDLFHCFGCGLGGDVIRWVELSRKGDFLAALEYLDPGGQLRRPGAGRLGGIRR